MGALDADLGHPAHPGSPHPGHVDGRRQGGQGVVCADVGGGLLAADVLLTCLQRQRVGTPAVVIVGEADQTPRHAPHQLLPHRHEAEVGPAEGRWDAERLAVPDGDVETEVSRRGEQGAGDRVGAADRDGSDRPGGLGHRGDLRHRPEEPRQGDDRAGIAGSHRRAHVGGGHHLDPPPLPVGADHGECLGVEVGGHEHPVPPGLGHGHHHALGGRGGAVVEGGVGHVQARELADHRLELEDRLECPLGCLGLVGGVGRVELGARDGGTDNGRDVAAVDAGPEERVQ